MQRPESKIQRHVKGNDPMLSIKNLSIFINRKKIVNKLNFSIEQGQCLGLVGESGSGKSMTAAAIMQLLPANAAVSENSQIHFKQQDLLTLTESQMRGYRGKKIAMIFQDATAAFNPVMRIKKQMQEALKYQKDLNKKQQKDYALNLLDKVGIKETRRCYDAFPHELSGGMRQRAMIAMALSGKPELIIADEPTTALDVTIQAQVIKLLCRLQQQENITLLFISHNLAIVSQISDQVAVMQKGEIVEYNNASDFFSQPRHDYSKKLLSAASHLDNRTRENNTADSELCSIKQVSHYFYGKRQLNLKRTALKAIDNVNFSLYSGKTVAMIGESGSGKTTVAKILASLYSASDGEIYFDNKPLSQSLRCDIQMIFQDPYGSLNPRRTVADSIAEGLSAQKTVTKKSAQLAIVDQLLLRVGLSDEDKWRYPHEFSGGERQRICIARALALRPKLLILDEPTSALDASIQMQVLELLRDLQSQYKIAYFLITHDFSVVSWLAHRVVVMHQGHIVETGETLAVLEQPQHEYTQKLIAATPTIRSF